MEKYLNQISNSFLKIWLQSRNDIYSSAAIILSHFLYIKAWLKCLCRRSLFALLSHNFRFTTLLFHKFIFYTVTNKKNTKKINLNIFYNKYHIPTFILIWNFEWQENLKQQNLSVNSATPYDTAFDIFNIIRIYFYICTYIYTDITHYYMPSH